MRGKNLSYFYQLLRKFEQAAINHAISGGGHPDDIPLKKEDYLEAKKRIIGYFIKH
jgi:hypothetical protein